MKKCAALVVDDDTGVQQLLQITLRRHCSNIAQATDGAEAAELLRDSDFDVVVLDLMLPKMNGFEVAKIIESLPKRPRLIVLSAIARYFNDRFPPDTVILEKPFEIERLDQVFLSMTQSSDVATHSSGNAG
jgi:CheY-like chemotaxis protein